MVDWILVSCPSILFISFAFAICVADCVHMCHLSILVACNIAHCHGLKSPPVKTNTSVSAPPGSQLPAGFEEELV